MKLIDASSRIAISALLHDFGKLAERARIEVNREQLEIWKQLDCPHWDARPTHIHAAYTTAGRLAFWDCNLTEDWVTKVENANQMHTEVKSENRINRITGVAEHPRNTERVPAGAEFDFRLSLKVLNGEDDLLPAVLAGLRLIELDSLGGCGSRG